MPDPLDALLTPHVRPCTLVTLTPDAEPLAPTVSRFGGLPYCEAGESWPVCAACQRGLSFIAQLDLRKTTVREPHVELFAFYYCWECFPQDHAHDAWEIRSYLDPRDDIAVALAPPADVKRHPQCRVAFAEARSLPRWDELYARFRTIFEAAKAASPDAASEHYRAACERVAGPQAITSVVGGYPRWVQGDDAPVDARFVAQLDTESAAEVSWGDSGSIFLFLSNDDPPAWWMVFQSC